MVTEYELDLWLQEGISAAKAGQIEQARFRLLDVVEQDQTNEAAWFWLYHVFYRNDDKRICLENLLTINPQNEWAGQELQQYLAPQDSHNQTERGPAATPNLLSLLTPWSTPLRLVVAFWAGISTIFLGGGIIAAGEWLVVTLRTDAIANYITVTQLLELVVAIVFIIFGIIGLNVAVGLYTRSSLGFYGSLLLALGLLMVGPTVSLIASPPNYLTLVCTGGVAGIIVLLTLASQPELKQTQIRTGQTR